MDEKYPLLRGGVIKKYLSGMGQYITLVDSQAYLRLYSIQQGFIKMCPQEGLFS